MNHTRIALATLAATVVYFAVGGILFAAMPFLKDEFLKYPTVYRTQDDMKRVMPVGMLGILVAILTVTIMFALAFPAGGLGAGLHFGALVGIFVVTAFVLHNYMNLNIGTRITVWQGVAYFVEWLAVGAAIGLIYTA